jgi:hypothetical protein
MNWFCEGGSLRVVKRGVPGLGLIMLNLVLFAREGSLGLFKGENTNVGGQSPGRSLHTELGSQSLRRSLHTKDGCCF